MYIIFPIKQKHSICETKCNAMLSIISAVMF